MRGIAKPFAGVRARSMSVIQDLTTKEADELDKVEMDLGWNEIVSQLYLDRGYPHDRSGGMSLTTTAGTTSASSASPGQVVPSCRGSP